MISKPTQTSSILSGAVALSARSPEVQSFLANPGIADTTTHLKFGSGMPDTPIMFADIEWLEGLTNPIHVPGGDWMALVGIQRGGTVWVAAGTDATMAGSPSTSRNWQTIPIGQKLQPDTWYTLKVVADFGTRHFVSFSISGGTINETFNLSAYSLDYPNFMPFDKAALIYLVGGMNSRTLTTSPGGTPVAFFDNVTGINPPFFADFSQSAIGSQPLTSPVIMTRNYAENTWYLERAEAKFTIDTSSGVRLGKADASL